MQPWTKIITFVVLQTAVVRRTGAIVVKIIGSTSRIIRTGSLPTGVYTCRIPDNFEDIQTMYAGVGLGELDQFKLLAASME